MTAHAIVTAPAEIDPLSCSDFAAALSVAGPGNIIVECAGVTFIDSAGLVVLIEAHERLACDGRKLILSNPSKQLHRLLEVTDLASLFVADA